MAELKCCPFCGGRAYETSSGRQHEHGAIIKCERCGCQTARWTTSWDAAETWNRRVNDAVKTDAV